VKLSDAHSQNATSNVAPMWPKKNTLAVRAVPIHRSTEVATRLKANNEKRSSPVLATQKALPKSTRIGSWNKWCKFVLLSRSNSSAILLLDV